MRAACGRCAQCAAGVREPELAIEKLTSVTTMFNILAPRAGGTCETARECASARARSVGRSVIAAGARVCLLTGRRRSEMAQHLPCDAPMDEDDEEALQAAANAALAAALFDALAFVHVRIGAPYPRREKEVESM